MTERKPPDVSWESWIERQIRDGQRDGAFHDLPGAGRPIDDLDRPRDEFWWVKAKMRRENVVVTPPTIAIRSDRDATVAAALEARTEAEVRELIAGLNVRIADVNRRAATGPPSTVAPLDVESIVDRWRLGRPPGDPVAADGPGDTSTPTSTHVSTRDVRRRRFRLGRRRPGASERR